jgi:hypothetical protein
MKTFLEYHKDSGLGKWLDEKWVDISRKDKTGKHPPCGASAKKEGRSKKQKRRYPKCRPAAQARSMSKKLKTKAVAQKRRAESKKPHTAGRQPVVVSHKNLKESRLYLERKKSGKKVSKNKPNNPKLWAQAQAWARRTYDVHPSAYSNLGAVKWYNKRGGTWRKTKSSKNESTLLTFLEWRNQNL